MLAIQARCQAGHIHLANEGIPLDSKVVVLFLPPDDSAALTDEQRTAAVMQSHSGFAKSVLLNPAEDCWNDV